MLKCHAFIGMQDLTNMTCITLKGVKSLMRKSHFPIGLQDMTHMTYLTFMTLLFSKFSITNG